MIKLFLAILFPIIAWSGPSITHTNDAAYQDLKTAYFNGSALPTRVFGTDERFHQYNIDALKMASKYGVRLFVTLPEIDRFLKTGNDDELKKLQDTIVKRYKGNPGLYGYFIKDEPSAKQFPMLAKVYKVCQEADPDSICEINLFSTYISPQLLGTPTYEEYVQQYINIVHPKTISFDHYPILYINNKYSYRDDFYYNLAVIRNAALKYKIPAWAFCLTVPHGPYPMPTEGQIRWQVFHNLAYGMKGIQYFTYETPYSKGGVFHNAIIDENGKKTPTYDIVKQVNAEIVNLGPTLLSLTSTDVMVTGELKKGSNPFTPGQYITSCTGDPVLIGIFRGPEKSHYVMIVNRNFMGDANASIKLARGVRSLTEVNKSDGKLSTPIKNSANGIPIKLSSGDGRLFRIN